MRLYLKILELNTEIGRTWYAHSGCMLTIIFFQNELVYYVKHITF